MKVRLLKDLPTCKAGTIGVKEGSKIVFDKNTRSPYFFELSEIEFKTDWFKEISEEPKDISPFQNEMWWLLNTISNAPIHEMHDLQCEAQELIEKTLRS